MLCSMICLLYCICIKSVSVLFEAYWQITHTHTHTPQFWGCLFENGCNAWMVNATLFSDYLCSINYGPSCMCVREKVRDIPCLYSFDSSIHCSILLIGTETDTHIHHLTHCRGKRGWGVELERDGGVQGVITLYFSPSLRNTQFKCLLQRSPI